MMDAIHTLEFQSFKINLHGHFPPLFKFRKEASYGSK